MRTDTEIQNEYQKIALEIGHNIAQYFLSQPELIKSLTELKAEADSLAAEKAENARIIAEHKAKTAELEKHQAQEAVELLAYETTKAHDERVIKK